MTVNVPDFMPVLSYGPHSSPEGGACIMEYVSFLAGEYWSDAPKCVHTVLASAAREVNDSVNAEERQELLPLIGRFFNTNSDDIQLSVKLVLFCAKYVQHLNTDPSVADAIKATEAVLADPSEENKLAASDSYVASLETFRNFSASYDAARSASYAARFAASASAKYAVIAVSYAVIAVSYSVDAVEDKIQFLSDLLDEYDRLTGRTAEKYTEVTAQDYQRMYELTRS